MARTGAFQQVFNDLQDRYGRLVAEAFLRAVEDIRSTVQLQRLIARIEARDIEGALETLDIDPAAYDEMLDRIRDAHAEGGRKAAEALPRRLPDGTALTVRFDGRNPEAEAWLRDHSARLVTRITEDQRAAVRMSLLASMETGRNPRSAALDIVGRVNRATGRREGGILGLTQAQEGYVRSAREELASGDPALLRQYLTRGRRDKRFDRSVTKAIREEQPVPAEIAAKAVTAYERRLLQLRGEMIGRTEALTSLNRAAYEAIRQAVAAGKIAESAVRRVWRSARDLRVRHTHRGLNGDSVKLAEAFISPSGARMLFPGDTSLGAPASEIIGCRCVCETRIDFLANLR